MALIYNDAFEGPQTGLYATYGVAVSHTVTHCLALRAFGIQKTFAKKGHDETSLREAWIGIDVSADCPPPVDKVACVVLGGMDYIISYRKARRTLEEWIAAGVPIKILTQPRLGHTGTISWHKDNIGKMLAQSELL